MSVLLRYFLHWGLSKSIVAFVWLLLALLQSRASKYNAIKKVIGCPAAPPKEHAMHQTQTLSLHIYQCESKLPQFPNQMYVYMCAMKLFRRAIIFIELNWYSTCKEIIREMNQKHMISSAPQRNKYTNDGVYILELLSRLQQK
eukprot:3368774-Amphidinium_carterae.1